MIGIYGGTFDPVHFGHLRPAVDVVETLQLEQLWFIPCGEPVHRDAPIASCADRLAMLQLATTDYDKFVVDDREIQRAGGSYMVDTVSSLIQDYPEQQFCLVVGMDAFMQFDAWRDWQTITGQVSIVVTCRPQFSLAAMEQRPALQDYIQRAKLDDANAFVQASKPSLFFCSVTQLDISATQIRDLVNQGISTHYLMPTSVANYISNNGLYH